LPEKIELGNGNIYPIISLFAGAGGLDLGFVKGGFKPILAVDQDPAACLTYKHNFPSCHVIQQNLSEIPRGYLLERLSEIQSDEKPVGIIGGPPCQAFSESNRYKKGTDARARLPEKYAELIGELNRALELDFFVFENVPGLRSPAHAALFKYLKQLFQRKGFLVFESELDAKDFGVPQQRKRVFCVGFNRKLYGNLEFSFPIGRCKKWRTVHDAIYGLPRPIYFKRGIQPEDIPFHMNHWCMRPHSEKFFNGCLTNEEEWGTKGRPFRVLAWDKPSWTVAYGNREVHIHPSGKRRLSVYEAMLLQGFPHLSCLRGSLSDQIRLVSDAVPPPVAAALARSIKKCLDVRENANSSQQNNQDGKAKREHLLLLEARLKKPSAAFPHVLNTFFTRFARSHERSFPWRKRHVSAYQLIIAEILLKQTKAEAVGPIWKKIIKKHKTPISLSRAKLKSLTSLIEPLGLHKQRALALKKVGEHLTIRFAGQVPHNVEDLLSLPHIGLYTACAIGCFKFDKILPIVDTNVLRVFSRITGKILGRDLRRNPEAWSLAWSILPKSNVHLHNYGILDFAAKICTPKRPLCTTCPIREVCIYGNAGGKSSALHP